MGSPLTPDLAAAYVRELSAEIVAVAVLDAQGRTLHGDPALSLIAEQLNHGAVTTQAGTAWVAKGPEVTLIAVAPPSAETGPTALDAAAAVGAETPLETIENPSPELKTALSEVIAGT